MSSWSDKFVRFFIENLDDIKELNKLSEFAQKQLVSSIDSDMWDCIESLESESPQIRVDSDKNKIWWFYVDEYDEDKDQGPWFAYEPNWDRLFSDDDPDGVAHLCLHISTGQFRKKAEKATCINDLVNGLREKAGILGQNRIRFDRNWSIDYSDARILVRPIQREEIMATIADRTELKDEMYRVVRDFTFAIHSVLESTSTITRGTGEDST